MQKLYYEFALQWNECDACSKEMQVVHMQTAATMCLCFNRMACTLCLKYHHDEYSRHSVPVSKPMNVQLVLAGTVGIDIINDAVFNQ